MAKQSALEKYQDEASKSGVIHEQIQADLRSIASERARVMDMMEDSITDDDSILDDYTRKLNQLDQQESDLTRKLQIVQKAAKQPTKKLRKAAADAYSELEEEMAVITKRWNEIEKQLIKKRAKFLKYVAELGRLRNEETQLRSVINSITPDLDPSLKNKWIPGPSEEGINLRKASGFIFINTMEIREAYLKGKVPE